MVKAPSCGPLVNPSLLISYLLLPDAVDILPYITHVWHRGTIIIHVFIRLMKSTIKICIVPLFIAVD